MTYKRILHGLAFLLHYVGLERRRRGGLNSADCRLADWRVETRRSKRVASLGVANQHTGMVVSDPEPTPQRQKLLLSMRQSPGAK